MILRTSHDSNAYAHFNRASYANVDTFTDSDAENKSNAEGSADSGATPVE